MRDVFEGQFRTAAPARLEAAIRTRTTEPQRVRTTAWSRSAPLPRPF